jgi:TetR/AcrR family transcriptional regulator
MTQESPDTRERILDAAEEAFASGGYAAARVAGIAEAAGVNKAMLYYYFGSKDALYQAALERTLDQLAALAQGVLADPQTPPDRRAEAFLRGYFGVLRARPRFFNMVMRELLDGGERLAPLVAPRLPVLLAAFGRELIEGQARGALNPGVEPRMAAMVLVSPFVVFASAGPFVQGLLGLDPELIAPAFEHTALTILMDGLRTRE